MPGHEHQLVPCTQTQFKVKRSIVKVTAWKASRLGNNSKFRHKNQRSITPTKVLQPEPYTAHSSRSKGQGQQVNRLRHNSVLALPVSNIESSASRVFNRPEFSGRHDCQAKKFECRTCTKYGSHAVGLQEKWSKNLMQNKTY